MKLKYVLLTPRVPLEKGISSMMIDTKKFDEFIQQILKLLPDSLRESRNSIENKIKVLLIAVLKDADLVTREEFDVQTKLLARTRAKLNELQTQIGRLEQSMENSSPS